MLNLMSDIIIRNHIHKFDTIADEMKNFYSKKIEYRLSGFFLILKG